MSGTGGNLGHRADELRVVPVAEVATEDLLALVRRSLGSGGVPRCEEFWIWKHRSNPFGDSPGLVALDAAGNAVGLRIFLRWRWRLGDRTWSAVRAVDTATDPAWRRRGVFRRLTLELVDRLHDEGVAFVFNTPNRLSLAGYLDMGWREVGRLPILVRPLLPALLRWTASPPVALEPAAAVLGRVDTAGLLSRLGDEHRRLHTPLDRKLLGWRYARAPGLDYRAASLEEGGARALAVFRLRRRGGLQELGVADILASPGRAGSRLARRLLRGALHRAPAHYAVVNAAPGTHERRLALRCGFLPVAHRGPRLAVRRLTDDPDLPDLTRWDSWSPTLGDLELF